ncbi:Signal peptidase I S [Fervidicola ferrireducens]|uniref:Signal peptidase I n=1 Tax=Fervidicola ferrireducens TaxID=520764 RepID=A0A140L3Q5_9FIRM|nr:signal peptidase I [Fervidicola ferrireducens]KXG75180.1 Signal peptidase I S [Fervidicola ferrireducens]
MRYDLKKEILDWIKSIAFALIIALAIRTYIFEPMIVPTGSMIPTIQVGDRILVNKYIYRFEPIKRGDIVVFKYPDDPKQTFVKRVIGLGGDEIEIRDGQLYVNGNLLVEPYLKEPMIGDFGPYKVPEGHYFMMGDNRNNSKDSRFWENMYVPKKLIMGKAVYRIWPPGRIGRLE